MVLKSEVHFPNLHFESMEVHTQTNDLLINIITIEDVLSIHEQK